MDNKPTDARRTWTLLGHGESHLLAARPSRHYQPRWADLRRAECELGRRLPPDVWSVRLEATEADVASLMERDPALLVCLRRG